MGLISRLVVYELAFHQHAVYNLALCMATRWALHRAKGDATSSPIAQDELRLLTPC
jgi:hypothetical protein